MTIYDSELNGEYLGWHSHNLRLVNCHITGEQPLCYAHDLVLENCTFGPDCDRAFEYSSVQATIKGGYRWGEESTDRLYHCRKLWGNHSR